MEFAGYYDASYPPELWETPAAPVALARESATEDEGRTVPAGTVRPVLRAADQQEDEQEAAGPALPVGLTVTAGTPGSYSPALTAATRPRNVTELVEGGCTPSPVTPWEPGQYVPVGERGKRAHWDGDTWRSGEAVPFQTRARRR